MVATVFESKFLPPSSIDLKPGSEVEPGRLVNFDVLQYKQDESDEISFYPGIPNPVNLDLSGASISYYTKAEDADMPDGQKIIYVDLFPSNAARVDILCHTQQDGQAATVLVNVYDRSTGYWMRTISTEGFNSLSENNQLSTFVFRITGRDSEEPMDVLTKTVLVDTGELDDVTDDGEPTGNRVFNMKTLVAQGKFDIIPPAPAIDS